MRRWVVMAACFLLLGQAAWAHRIDEYLQATLVTLQRGRMEASMRLIPGTQVAAGVIAAIDRNGDGRFSDDEERAYAEEVLRDLAITLDGRAVTPRLVRWSFPQPAELRDGLGEIHLEYEVLLPPGQGERRLVLANRHRAGSSVYLVNATVPEDGAVRITGQRRDSQQSVYEVDYAVGAAGTAGSQGWWNGAEFGSLFRLGMRHIAEGTDHLLFLLTLLLAAPLVAEGGRWGRARGVRESLLHILGIVTAFTVGHSVTLSLAEFGAVRVPERPVEVLIAASIFVSAVHALRPLVPGREAWIAGFFGLIHGLAFAATLDRLGMGRWERITGVLAFNLGIETVQMALVLVILPVLILLSRTRAYGWIRVVGAGLAGVAALGWMLERTGQTWGWIAVLCAGVGAWGYWVWRRQPVLQA